MLRASDGQVAFRIPRTAATWDRWTLTVESLRPGLTDGSMAAVAAEKFVRGMERVRAGLPTGDGGLDIDD